MAAAGAPDGECGRVAAPGLGPSEAVSCWGRGLARGVGLGRRSLARELGCGGARVESGPRPSPRRAPTPNPLAGMEEAGIDTEAETVAAEAPARPLNCVEAEAAAGVGAAAEDACAARSSLQPAPAQPPGDPAAQASVSNGEDAGGGGAERELVDLKIIWNKTKHDVKFPLDSTGSELKQKIHSITGNPHGTTATAASPTSPAIPSACSLLGTVQVGVPVSALSVLTAVPRSGCPLLRWAK